MMDNEDSNKGDELIENNNGETSHTIDDADANATDADTDANITDAFNVEDEEAPVSNSAFFPEDSTSRDSSSLNGPEGRRRESHEENEEDCEAEQIDPMNFEDEGQSLDAVSLQSGGDQSNLDKPQEDEPEVSASNELDESNDSKISETPVDDIEVDEGSAQKGSVDEDSMSNFLMTSESMQETEEIEADVDISAMMEVNYEEPEVIPIDSDDDIAVVEKNSHETNAASTGEDSEPILLNADQRVFEIDDDENVTEVDISNMMEIQVDIRDGEIPDQEDTSNSENQSRRPKRAAAQQAEKTIHAISAQEENIPSNVFRHRRKSQEDTDFSLSDAIGGSQGSPSASVAQKCFSCKKIAQCSITIRQYGSDIFLCSNTCFNKFRNQGKDESKGKSLPCSKCGIIDGNEGSVNSSVHFWETMNFCSDLCVGRYQMDVGSKCCTCGSNVPWNSLGKYCVRFGSDIRQFCTPQCLDNYKKNARVCFHCQLDIRRVGNVILANIPSKNTPKEFCSNDCVEKYCERHLHQPTRAKPQPEHTCNSCNVHKPVYRDLVLVNGSFKTCSDSCWTDTLNMKNVSKAEKCEMCTKYVNMDLGYTTPVYWLSSMNKVVGFCSHVCKNLYILSNRKIMSCTTCKVKKYNYDLVEFFSNGKSVYAVCSLACLPKNSEYMRNLRDVLYLPQPTSDKSTLSLSALLNGNGDGNLTSVNSGPIMSAVSSDQPPNKRLRKQSMGVNVNEVIDLGGDDDIGGDGSSIVEYNDDQIGMSDCIYDILNDDEIEDVIRLVASHANPPPTRSVFCSAKPKTRTVETQTDVSELNDMERIPLAPPEDIVHYVPVPVPTLVNVPFPGYFIDSPVPIPFPVLIPFPVPIPIILPAKHKESKSFWEDKDKKEDDDDSTKNSRPSSETTKENRGSTSSSSAGSSEMNEQNKMGTGKTTNENFDRCDQVRHHLKPQSLPINTNRTDNEQSTMLKDWAVGGQEKVTENLSRVENIRGREPLHSPHHYRPSPITPVYDSQNRPIVRPQPQESHQPHHSFGHFSSVTPPNNRAPCPPYNDNRICPPHNVIQSYNSSPPMAPPMPMHPVHPNLNYAPLTPQTPTPPPQPTNSFYQHDQRSYPALGMNRQSPPVISSPSSPHSFSSYPSAYPGAGPVPVGLSNVPPANNMIRQAPPKNPRVEYALRAWKMMFGATSDPRSLNSMEISAKLTDFINRGAKPNGERYRADTLLYISLGIQQLLRDCNMVDKLFYDNMYYNYVLAFTELAERERTVGINGIVEETHFWEASELGASSPGVLLFTLIFMFQKHFGLKTWEMHAGLQFHNIIMQSRYDQFGRFSKFLSIVGVPGANLTEVQENISSPQKCIIKIYEFYCFKSVLREGPFYKCPRVDYTPRTPWFTNQQIDKRHIYQMLVRATLIKSEDS